jgi:hypothetical protein
MSTSALAAALEPGELHRLALTAASLSDTPAQRAGAAALFEVLAGAGATSPSAPPAPETMPIPQVVTDLRQVLPASTLSALAELGERQRSTALAAEVATEDAWTAWELDAGMVRPAGCGPLPDRPPPDELAWLAGGPDLDDVRLGYGDASTVVASGFDAHG